MNSSSALSFGGVRSVRPDQLRPLLAPLAIFLCLLLVVSVVVPQFLGGGGPSIIAQQATPILLIALAQCVVLQVGSIDLSNASMALLCAILSAITLGPLGIASPFLCVGVVTLIGMLNGAVLTSTQIPSFALTLGTLGILQAACLVITGANVVYVTSNLELVSWLFQVQFLTLPVVFWLAVLCAILLRAFIRFTVTGQGLMALGFNERAAILSGLPVRQLKITAFGLSGFLAGLAGLSVIAISGAASSVRSGQRSARAGYCGGARRRDRHYRGRLQSDQRHIRRPVCRTHPGRNCSNRGKHAGAKHCLWRGSHRSCCCDGKPLTHWHHQIITRRHRDGCDTGSIR